MKRQLPDSIKRDLEKALGLSLDNENIPESKHRLILTVTTMHEMLEERSGRLAKMYRLIAKLTEERVEATYEGFSEGGEA